MASYQTWEDIINSRYVKKKTNLDRIIDLSISLRAYQKENSDTNISLVALNELRELGFKNTLGTFYLANIIEDLYSERKLLDTLGMCDYFDLSCFDNKHYEYLHQRYRIGDTKFYRGLIASSIANSTCESKNINDIVYGVLNSIDKNKVLELK